MSAVLRWRCDVCRSEAEVVEEVKRTPLALYSPKLPTGWVALHDTGRRVDLCSQRCVIAHHQSIVAREQRKLANDAT